MNDTEQLYVCIKYSLTTRKQTHLDQKICPYRRAVDKLELKQKWNRSVIVCNWDHLSLTICLLN